MTKKVMLTCYDASFAKICADAEAFDYLLVGDSMGNVIYGAKGTTEVQLDDIRRHTLAVRRGVSRSESAQKPLVVADLPIGTYDNASQALESAMILKEAGADIVKVEGPVYEVVRALREKNIRVCGHIGLTPQSIPGHKVQGKTEEDANRLFEEAGSLEKAGCELIVLELMPAVLTRRITDALKIPVIGIGAGPYCDGQVLVLYDLLGMDQDFNPKFLKKYLNGYELVKSALQSYSNDVREQKFPTHENSF